MRINCLFFLLAVFAIEFRSFGQRFLPYSRLLPNSVSEVNLDGFKKPYEREGQSSSMVVSAAVSGGGSRACYFTLGVLSGLESVQGKSNNLLKEIDFFSTVSGGGFGVGYYLSRFQHISDSTSFYQILRSDIQEGNDPEMHLSVRKFRNIIYNWLIVAARRRYYMSSCRRITQINDLYNKEYSSKDFRNSSGMRSLRFSDFWIPVDSSQVLKYPILINNGTSFNNNGRVPLAPLVLKNLQIKAVHKGLIHEKVSDRYGYLDLPIFYTTMGSAAFPGLLPQLILKQSDSLNLRIIDGGVADNIGYKTIFQLNNYLIANGKKKLGMIAIDASGQGMASYYSEKKSINIATIAGRQLYSTLESKYPEMLKDFQAEDLNCKKILLGISNIRQYCIDKKFALPAEFKTGKKVRAKKVLKKLLADLKIPSIDSIYGFDPKDLLKIAPTDKSASSIWRLYELAAHVETKLKIHDWEKEILIFAGRFVVELKREELAKFVD